MKPFPWGKIVGGVCGLFLGGPIGAAFGVVLGHSLDSGMGNLLLGSDLAALQRAFFETLFRLLGHLARSDGRVSEQEVAYTERLIARMGLQREVRRRAIVLFNQGKQPGFDWNGELRDFAQVSRGQPQLRRLLLELLIDGALADGRLKAEGRRILETSADALGVPRAELEAMLGRRGRGQAMEKVDPYAVLGVPRNASPDQVKRAYRRLMSRHHPDKLVAKGLPPEMMAVAERKTREIRAAYDQIKAERGVN